MHEPGDDRFRPDSAERDEPAARERGRRDRKGQLRKAEPMPSEGNAFFLGDPAGEFVSAVEGRSDDQQLLALASALQPHARLPEPAAMRNRGDSSRTHRATVSIL